MKILTLIRHTQADIAPGICYGHTDIDVAEYFHAEAEQVANWLSPPDLIITSPLLRCRRLAEFLAARHGCELRKHAALKEMNFGDWESRPWREIARSEIDAWSGDVLHYAPPNGESAQQLMLRVQTLLQDIQRLPQQHVALVAHGGSIRAVLALLAEIPLAQTLQWQIDYGAVISSR